MNARSSQPLDVLRQKLSCIVEDELAKCAKCGACAGVCPIYAEKNDEAYCARGKLLLARALAQGRLEAGATTQEIFNNCLICMACIKNCGSNVRLDSVVIAARELLAYAVGQHPVKRLVLRSLLPKPRRMATAVKGGGLLQPLMFAKLPVNSGLRRRFPLPGIAPDQFVPALARHPFLERVPEYLSPAAETHREDVIYFTGCAANYLLPTLGESVVYVLRALGIGVRIPKEQTCCGTPAAVAGEAEVVRELARQNLTVFGKNKERIITACGSGGHMLRHEFTRFLEKETGPLNLALSVASRCRDISEYLIKEIGVDAVAARISRKVSGRVTYHDPCHLGRALGITIEPRTLLRAVAEDFAEMPDAGRCCGSGGSYGMSHWNISRKILAKKMVNVRKASASIIATGCPACVIQLAAGAGKANIAVFHTIELVAHAFGYTPKDPDERRRFANLERL